MHEDYPKTNERNKILGEDFGGGVGLYHAMDGLMNGVRSPKLLC